MVEDCEYMIAYEVNRIIGVSQVFHYGQKSGVVNGAKSIFEVNV
jgi:hypothetical protein